MSRNHPALQMPDGHAVHISMTNNSKNDPSLIKTMTSNEAGEMHRHLAAAKELAAKRRRDEALHALSVAEQKFLTEYGFVPVAPVKGADVKWRARNGDLLEQDVAVASVKRWIASGWDGRRETDPSIGGSIQEH